MNTQTRTQAPAKVASWKDFSPAEITRAVELMIAPGDLVIPGVATAIFEALDYTPEDIREQLESGEHFNAGAAFAKLDTDSPEIINQ